MNWPSALLPPPTIDYGGDIDNTVWRTDMDSGRKRQRSRFSRQTRNEKVSWKLTEFEFGIFQSFVKYKLTNGADAFNIDLPMGAGDSFQTVSAKFVNGRYSKSYDKVMHWTVSANLEVEEVTLYTEGELDDFIAAGGPYALGLDFDWYFGTTLPFLVTITADQVGDPITDLAGWQVDFEMAGIVKSSVGAGGISLGGQIAYWEVSVGDLAPFPIGSVLNWSITLTSPTDQVTLLMFGTVTIIPVP